MAVFGNLFGPLAAGNGAGHCVEHQNPPQRELAHRNAVRHQLTQILDAFEAGLVVHA